MKLQFNPNSRTHKTIGKVALFSMLFQIFYPTTSWSQSSGPSQAESSGGSPSSQMVDLFTGDFNYSIPLMNVDGFPLTLTYNGNTTMNQEASWVGLGFNLNPGSINREMRGLPDDFDGDEVSKTTSIKENITTGRNSGYLYGIGMGVSGMTYLGAGLEIKEGLFYNTYTGIGFNFEYQHNVNYSTGLYGNTKDFGSSFGLSFNSNSGIGLSTSTSLGSGSGYNILGIGVSRSTLTTVGVTNSSRASNQKYIATTNSRYNLLSGHSSSTSSNISLGTKTYIPRISNNYINEGDKERYSFGAGAGVLPLVGISASFLIENYESSGRLIQEPKLKAFGYFNMDKAYNQANSLMDFNRENESVVAENMKVLPVTNLTYDIFRIMGSSNTGNFRAYRNDVGTVRSNQNYASSEVGSLSEDGMLSVPFGLGSSQSLSFGEYMSHGGSSGYSVIDNWKYKNIENNNPDAETYYFKEIGEKTPVETSFFESYGGNNPSAAKIGFNGPSIDIYSAIETYESDYVHALESLPAQNYTQEKKNRNTIYNQFTATEAVNLGIDKINSYTLNVESTPSSAPFTPLNRETKSTGGDKDNHHLSIINVVKPNGTRYNYDVPVYSLMEKQVTFNASLKSGDPASNIDTISNVVKFSGNDNSISNDRGRDEYYSSITLPGYASSFLLGSILSADYGDRTGDGVSEDDYGNYLKLNYTNVYGESDPFKWKSPYNKGSNSQASYMENNKSYHDDDLGHYEYGEKEMWYTNSIEGKNYIAKFYVSDRDDLLSVQDEDGTLDINKAAQKLDKIILYSKQDLEKNGNNAIPIQTVHFEYDYLLCKDFTGNRYAGASDSTSGKLTLKKVYTTYGDSKKGRLSPYEFNYGGSNADYSGMDVDRWGVYKPNYIMGNSNIDHPYAMQDTTFDDVDYPFYTHRDDASSSWSLTQIILPSGGIINVEYESDDYNSVQGRKPMIMTAINKFGYSDNISITYPQNGTYLTHETLWRRTPDVAYLTLPEPLDQSSGVPNAKIDFYNKYLKEIFEHPTNPKQVYYQCEVETKKGSDEYELVTGHFTIEDYGVTSTYDPYLIMKLENVADEAYNNMLYTFSFNYMINPIRKDVFQHLRQNVNRAIFPEGIENSIEIDVTSILMGLNMTLDIYQFAWKIKQGKSYIRLNEPTGKKLGGGNRVKKITFSDSWSDMVTTEDNYSYGQEYIYTNIENNSSGVVQYEPQIGNGINPLRQPVEYVIEKEGFPWDFNQHYSPFGESFFDAPYVGYSKVTVKNLKNSQVNNDMGYTVYDFYTSDNAKYRTRVKRTPIAFPLRFESAIPPFPGILQFDLLGKSQGFVIEKNDMHGKLQKVANYDAQGIEVSSEEYFYKDMDETCKVVHPDGTITDEILGRDYDFVHDISSTAVMSVNSVQTTTFQVWLPFQTNDSHLVLKMESYLLSSFTKVIHNYAVLDKVVTKYLGAETTSKNLAYDALTGNVIATTTNNEYDDEVKSLSYPAYWYYDGMGQAVNTINNHLTDVDIISGGIIEVSTSYNVEDYFRQGDELLIEGTTSQKAWVLDVDTTTTNNDLFLIDDLGDPLATQNNVNVRVIRSGHRNQQMTSMSSFTDLNPELTNLSANKVLGASAVEYKENWKILCGDCNPEIDSIVNPFEHGLLGVWRPNKSYAYQVDRNETSTSTAVDLREGGAYSAYVPFYIYEPSGGNWYSILDSLHRNYNGGSTEKWLLANKITHVNQSGAPIEAKDVLNRNSGVLFRYNNNDLTIPVAAANNAKYTDIAFDGFEDYENYLYYQQQGWCLQTGHFDFEKALDDGKAPGTTYAHTGKYSLKISNGDSLSVIRTVNASEGSCGTAITTDGYKIRECDSKQLFNPQSGKYLVNAWVMEATPGTKAKFNAPEIEVILYGDSITHDTIKVDNETIIDGWQQLEGVFNIHADADSIEVILRNNGASSGIVYFDDLRIHPFNSTMVTSVYDPIYLKKMADLDDYNYATFYEYNEQGILIRVKQETVDGIKTISETRSGIVKH